ncbi:MAG TPA: hypothetical protein VKB51_12975 [bacterium]|nr:hypothetical protein [bacterium]
MNKPNPHRTGRAALLGTVALLVGVVIAGCAPTQRYTTYACGERRLELAASYYEQAKDKLALHYRQRIDSALSDAYHASQDAVLLARATRNCDDFDEAIRRQAIDLIKTNLIFQKLVVSNMRDQDPGVVIDLYGSRYRDIFKNDIR